MCRWRHIYLGAVVCWVKIEINVMLPNLGFSDLVNGKEKEVNLNLSVFNTVDEVPNRARGTIMRLENRGIINGDTHGRLGLSWDLVRMFVVNDKTGITTKILKDLLGVAFRPW